MYSYSKLGTFDSCPLKYKLHYIEKWEPIIKVGGDLANKGLAFHEMAETWITGQDKEDGRKVLNEKIKEYNVDENKYPLQFSVEKFEEFWNYFVAPREKRGYKVCKELEITGTLGGEDFIGYTDLMLDSPYEMIVLDYKSAKNPAIATYKKQLILYAYFLGIKKQWTIEQIAERTRLFLFFPLAYQEYAAAPRIGMEKSLKEAKFTAEEIREVLAEKEDIINQIKEKDWSHISALSGKPSFQCKWCQYSKSQPNEEGFIGCRSGGMGENQPIGQKFIKKTSGEAGRVAETMKKLEESKKAAEGDGICLTKNP